MPNAKNDMPPKSYLDECLTYDAEAGNLLWRKRPLSHFRNLRVACWWNARYAGRPAFTARTDNGYLNGSIDGHRMLAHRVVWRMTHGVVPAHIDHINGNKADNRLGNLRDTSGELENGKNQKIRRDNTSGVLGVYFCKQTRKWAAEIIVNGRKIHLGRFVDIKDAAAARQEANVRHGFHPNHGHRS